MYTVKGRYISTFFQNDGFRIALIRVIETDLPGYEEDEIVVTGAIEALDDDAKYVFEGTDVTHPKYGRQIKVTNYFEELPTGSKALVEYLSSAKFPGIGEKMAAVMVDTLGDNLIEDILDDASVLEQIPRLTPLKAKMIVTNLKENYMAEKNIIEIGKFGFTREMSGKIDKMLGGNSLEQINENPYVLCGLMETIKFKDVDKLANKLNFEIGNPLRVQAGIKEILYVRSVETGDTYVEANELLELAGKLLGAVPTELIAENINELLEVGDIQKDGLNIFYNPLYFCEMGIAGSIKRILNHKEKMKIKDEHVEKAIAAFEADNGIEYDESQKEAIIGALKNNFFLLSGGPGTGKTTVIKGLMYVFSEIHGIDLISDIEDIPINLAAPTGKAAKRMSEACVFPASTIHRMLDLRGEETIEELLRRDDKMVGKLLIIDETSMIDTYLAHVLLKAVPAGMKVIFVGDKDQLPSVGPGHVFSELLSIAELPHKELEVIHRQGEGSTIIGLARAINRGELPEDFDKNTGDRSFIETTSANTMKAVEKVLRSAKKSGFGAFDLQVMIPMYRGVNGITNANKMIQEIYNPLEGLKKEIDHFEVRYRIGDKVMQLENDPEKKVYNGDVGEIVSISFNNKAKKTKDMIVVKYDDEREAEYPRKEFGQITHAYAISIHKAQGSEYDLVVMPFVKDYGRMLWRNLLYTGVTRAKEKLVMVGEREAFTRSIANVAMTRKTALGKRLAEVLELEYKESEPAVAQTEVPTVEVTQEYDLFAVDPMIGVEKTPYDF
ncbi:MAG: ATP-dependent RecD-like DNA helicase [Lactobacillales bacterium]|jgi:exodeoxyribonuclease V alpha subunit|nr:ATP-dependent RecD-like DNA helicase [Lactobacillales bacterium]